MIIFLHLCVLGELSEIIVFFVLFRFPFGMQPCPTYHEDHSCHD